MRLVFPLITVTVIAVAAKTTSKFHKFISCLNQYGLQDAMVVQRNNSDPYKELNFQWNIRVETKYPLAYFIARNVGEIQAAVKCGKSIGLRIIPKSGGHGYEKYAYGDSNTIIVDLQKLNRVSVNKSTSIGTIGPGAHVGQVVYGLWSQGRYTLPLGACPTVGVSGLALGGGIGLFSRLYGLTSDNIIEMNMIDASGKLLVVNENSNKDLFWALRGGGSGNSFGIVTKFKFKLFPVPPKVIYAIVHYDLTQFSLVFGAWDKLFRNNPAGSINGYFTIIRNIIAINLVDIHDETSVSLGTSRMDKIISNFPPPKNLNVHSLSYPEFILSETKLSGYRVELVNLTKMSDLVSLTKYNGQIYFKAKSFFTGEMKDESEMLELYLLLRKLVPKGHIIVEPLGGAVNDLSSSDTSFVHRGKNNLYIWALYYELESRDDEELFWLKYIFETSKLLLNHKESYQNYVDAGMKDYLNRYYGSNLKRLVGIKKMVDPDNFFHNQQSIPPSL